MRQIFGMLTNELLEGAKVGASSEVVVARRFDFKSVSPLNFEDSKHEESFLTLFQLD